MSLDEYARPELLAEPDWLWERRDDPKLRIIDCSSMEAYQRAHIPGAVRVPRHPFLKTEPNPEAHLNEPLYVIGAEDFGAAMSEAGISSDTTVIAYDSVGHNWATRLWWVLRYYGHENAKVLHGGIHRWLHEGRPLTGAPAQVDRADFVPRTNESAIVRIDELLERYDDADVQVVNVMLPDFYSGASDPFRNRRRGHIPGSVNVPFTEFFTDGTRRTFKAAPELHRVLEGSGVEDAGETVVHCQGGVATTLGVFVLTLLGRDQVRCYDAAMGEWANRDDTPLVEGAQR